MSQAIHAFHHAQPRASSTLLISSAEFYQKLLAHDWYYSQSDDGSAYQAGKAAHDILHQQAKDAGPIHQWLLNEFTKHFFTGEPWGNERHPLPAPPTELHPMDAMKIRTELAKAEFAKKAIDKFAAVLPAKIKALDPVKTVLEKVCLHGFYAGNAMPPSLIGQHPKLRKAWEDGQSMVFAVAPQAI